MEVAPQKLIQGVKAAVDLKIEAPKALRGNLQGRSFYPLSYYVLIGTSCLATIAYVAAWIYKKSIYAWIGGGLTLFIGALGAYEVRRLFLTKQLEKIDESLKKRIQELQSQLVQEQEQNKQIRLNTDKMEQTISDYKKILAEQQQNVQTLNKNIQETTAKLQETEKNLVKLANIYPPIKEVITIFLETGTKLLQNNQTAEALLRSLMKSSQDLGSLEDLAHKDVQKIEGFTKSIQSFCKEAASISKLVQEQFHSLQTDFTQVQEENQKLKSEVTELETLKTDLATQVKAISEREKKYKDHLDKMRLLLPDHALREQELKALQEQNKELKRLKALHS